MSTPLLRLRAVALALRVLRLRAVALALRVLRLRAVALALRVLRLRAVALALRVLRLRAVALALRVLRLRAVALALRVLRLRAVALALRVLDISHRVPLANLLAPLRGAWAVIDRSYSYNGRMKLGALLRLRCPICGKGKLFHGYFDSPVRCPRCGYFFMRESGYFLPHVAIGYDFTVLAALGCWLGRDYVGGIRSAAVTLS